MNKYQELVVSKLTNVINNTAEGYDDKILSLVDAAGRTFIGGAGRSLLVSRFFAMRLVHAGYQVSMVGEVVTPSIQAGDLFIDGWFN